MAEVVLARAEVGSAFEKHVVLKSILPQYASDRRFVKMFMDEARLAAVLDHQNIVHVHDLGQMDGTCFVAMEYLHGRDLKQILTAAGGPLPLAHTLEIAIGVAAGLHYAHEACATDGNPLGVVHRDVSPSNIFVTFDGAVKVLDFGIARASSHLIRTETGSIKGKLLYMSPEQARGNRIDRRSDVYSTGAVLVEMGTGQRTVADSLPPLELLSRVEAGEVDLPEQTSPDFPPGLLAIAHRCLSLNPDDRFHSCAELRDALEALAIEQAAHPSPSALSRFMKGLFGDPPRPWQERQLEKPRPSDELWGDPSDGTRELAGDPPPGPRLVRFLLLLAIVAAAGVVAVLLASRPWLGRASATQPGQPAFSTTPARRVAIPVRAHPATTRVDGGAAQVSSDAATASAEPDADAGGSTGGQPALKPHRTGNRGRDSDRRSDSDRGDRRDTPPLSDWTTRSPLPPTGHNP